MEHLIYSNGQANLQFSNDTKILCEIKFGNFRRYDTAILDKIPHLKVLKYPNFSLSGSDTQNYVKLKSNLAF